MKLLNKIKKWNQDRRQVSMEKHEIQYIRRVARKYLEEYKYHKKNGLARIHVSTLQRLCKYVLKTTKKK